MRRAKARSQRLINHNCFNSINDVLPGTLGAYRSSACFCWSISIVMAGPAMGRNSRARVLGAALPCLALIAPGTAARSQTVTPDLFSSTRTSQLTSPDSPLRRTAAEANDPLNSPKLQDRDKPAPSRIGQIPKYGLPAASGGSRFRLTIRPTASARSPNTIRGRPGQSRRSVPVVLRRRCREYAARLSFPPSESAHKTPIPPAMAGTVVGQPPRKCLRVDDHPLARSALRRQLLIRSPVELTGGHDTNPGRTSVPRGSPLYVVAPESSRSPTGNAMLLSTPPRSLHRLHQHFPPVNGVVSSAPTNSTVRISSAMSMAVSMSPATPACSGRRDCVSPPTIPVARTCRRPCPDIPVYATFGGTLGVDRELPSPAAFRRRCDR